MERTASRSVAADRDNIVACSPLPEEEWVVSLPVPSSKLKQVTETENRLAKALGHPLRFHLLRALSITPIPLTVSELTATTGSSDSTIRWHLARLIRLGAVDATIAPEATRFSVADTPLGHQIARMFSSLGAAADAPEATEPGEYTASADVPASPEAETVGDALGMQSMLRARDDLDTLLNQMPSGVAIYDAEGRLIRMNPAGDEITRRQLDAAEGAEVRQARFGMRYLDGRPLRETDSPSGRARRGETFANVEYLIDGAHGQSTVISTSGAPLRDANGSIRGAVLVFHDVTELRRLERTVAAQRATAEAIIEAAPVGIALFDVTDDFHCIRHNQPYLEQMGPQVRTRGSVVGMRVADTIDAETYSTVRAIFQQVLATGKPVTFDEFPAVLPGSSEQRWFKWSLTPLGSDGRTTIALLGTFIEVTDQVLARQHIQQRASYLQAVLSAMPEAVAIADSTGNIVLANAAAEELWGKPTPTDLHVEQYATTFECYALDGRLLESGELPLPRALTGETVVGQELVYARPDGTKRDLLCSAAPLYDSDALPGSSSPTSAVVAFQDISHIRALERMRDEFLGLAAHELRTPLTTILASLQLMLRLLARPPEDSTLPVIGAALERTLHQADRLKTLVNDLVDTSRISSGRLEVELTPCDVGEMLEEVISAQRLGSPNRILTYKVTPEVAERPVWVKGDAFRLAQVFDNLLVNAFKYSAEAEPVDVTLTARDGFARIAVRDFGQGIPPESIPLLFDRFYRVPGLAVQSGSGVGLGLGLYITHGIVEQHKGRLSVDSTPGEGSTFTVELPLLQDELDASAASNLSGSSAT